MAEALSRLQDFPFTDESLRKAALTHRSVGNHHNERLEFLGDAVLSFVIAEALYTARPGADEGDLTRLRSHLVRGKTLADIADKMDLSRDIEFGRGVLKSGGHRLASIREDAFEALLGAIYLDAGFDTVKQQILNVFDERLKSLPPVDQLKDAKTRLQECLQARGADRPTYEVLEESGPPHQKSFLVRCVVQEHEVRAEGSSRRQAEQDAARQMLQKLSPV